MVHCRDARSAKSRQCPTSEGASRAPSEASPQVRLRRQKPALELRYADTRLVRGWSDHERAEQAVLLVEGAGGEEEGIRRPAGGGAAAEGERPEAVDLDRPAVRGMERTAVLELALAVEVRGVEGVDAAVAEVADEQVAAEEPEVGRGEGEPPGRVELALGSDAT